LAGLLTPFVTLGAIFGKAFRGLLAGCGTVLAITLLTFVLDNGVIAIGPFWLIVGPLFVLSSFAVRRGFTKETKHER
jgi:hypothetical protein